MLIEIYTLIAVTLRDIVDAGGPVVYGILLACFILWALIFERMIFFRFLLPRQARELLEQWHRRPDKHIWRSRKIREAMISRLNAEMNANMPMLRVLVPMSPLLGLLGTIVGMLEVFDSMAARGSTDARTLASGVSQAMVCTMAGLMVSITGLFPVYYFKSRARSETELLADKFTY
ncbi:MAG: MotA/TolQ/ExbB proton channel family protein [Panacagrimonas sp.]